MKRLLLILFVAVAPLGCDKKAETPSGAPGGPSNSIGAAAGAAVGKRKIAVIPKGTTHDFWKSVHAGAEKARQELGDVEVVFRGPEKEDDREQQIALVENFVSDKVDAIVLAPLDDKALVSPARRAMAAKVPVVVIDSGLAGEPGKDFASFVATDNHRGGQLAGERMREVLGGKGKVLLLRYQEGSASTMERERGFVEVIAKAEGMELIDPKRYAGATRATAQEASENLLTAHTDMVGIFCPNESSTFGMLLALRARGLAGKVRFVGFDASPGLVKALADKELDGLVVQNPMKMGYLGVKTAADAIAGRPVELRVDTGVAMVTPDNMTKPEFAELLNPDLARYLGK